MRIVPLNRFDYKVYPIEEGDNVIEISEEDFYGLEMHVKCFNEDLTAVIDYVKTDEEIRREQAREHNEYLRHQIEDIKLQLYSTDYLTLKYLEGGLSETDFENAKAMRQGWREEINDLESQMVSEE